MDAGGGFPAGGASAGGLFGSTAGGGVPGNENVLGAFDAPGTGAVTAADEALSEVTLGA